MMKSIDKILFWLSMIAVTACVISSMLLIFLMLLWLAFAYAPWVILVISAGIVIYAVCYIAVMIKREDSEKKEKNEKTDRQTA